MWRPFAKSKTKLTKCTHNNQQPTIFALKIEYYVKKQKQQHISHFGKLKKRPKKNKNQNSIQKMKNPVNIQK